MKNLLLTTAILCLSLSVKAQDNGSGLDADAFQAAMAKPGVELIDLRPEDAYNDEHFEGAKHIDWEDGTLLDYVKEMDKDRPILLYCGSGYRSGMAKEALIKAGYTHVYDLEGGMEALEEAAKPAGKP